MNDKSESRPPDKVGRTLIKAFAFAGAILGVGAYGLVRTACLLGRELGWLEHIPEVGAAYWWLAGGAVLGFLAGWILVKSRPRA